MVGLGTQDTLEEAKGFVSRHGITFPMVWEEGFESWRPFRVTRQPAAVLVDPQGKELARFQGEITESDQEEILRIAQAA